MFKRKLGELTVLKWPNNCISCLLFLGNLLKELGEWEKESSILMKLGNFWNRSFPSHTKRRWKSDNWLQRAETKVLPDSPPWGSTRIGFWIPEKHSSWKCQALQKTGVGKSTEPNVLETPENRAHQKAEVRYSENRGWVKNLQTPQQPKDGNWEMLLKR